MIDAISAHIIPWVSSDLTTTVCVVVTFLFFLPILKRYWTTMSASGNIQAPFPFLSLPPELRNIIYNQLIEDPSYPARSISHSTAADIAHTRNAAVTAVDSCSKWIGATFSLARGGKRSNWLMLANHQVYDEYMDVLCKGSKFTLAVDSNNHMRPSLWSIRRDTLRQIRKCDLTLNTTSSMLGTADPRHMTQSWALRDKICEQLKGVGRVQDLNLHVQAVGDPLWNPLWVWYHASQAFKETGDLKFQKITFSLDSWSPGENHLKRNESGNWTWRCREGHHVEADKEDLQIREFCAKLYAECGECKPRGSER